MITTREITYDDGTVEILRIAPAERKGAHLLIQLYGGSQSGKTFSALQLARGIVGAKGRIGGLCTESGRMRLYSDAVPGGFDIGELRAPFSPGRYRAAINQFIKHGVDILVIDSFSHVWEGIGGVLEMADEGKDSKGRPLQGLIKWQQPKREYNKLVQLLMQSSIDIIFCSRAKQPTLERTNDQGRKEFFSGPWKPIQDKALRFEMTFVFPMLQDGNYDTRPRDELGGSLFKCPGDLRGLFDGKPLTIAHGEKIAEWVGGAKTVDNDLEMFVMAARTAAAEGSAVLDPWLARVKAEWSTLSDAKRAKMTKSFADDLKSQAAEVDAEKARLAELANLAAGLADEEEEPGNPWAVKVAAFVAEAAGARERGMLDTLLVAPRTQELLKGLRAAVASDESLAPLLAQAEGAVE
jgi:hypothetical protein